MNDGDKAATHPVSSQNTKVLVGNHSMRLLPSALIVDSPFVAIPHDRIGTSYHLLNALGSESPGCHLLLQFFQRYSALFQLTTRL